MAKKSKSKTEQASISTTTLNSTSSNSKKKNDKNSSSPTPNDDIKKPSRGLVIGENFGWTGKLPVTLLNEHVQKQKWNKVQYDMIKRSQGFIGIFTLSWENPKTKETLSIKFQPQYQPKQTTNEARHMTATYVLHRINYIKNMKMLLPLIFRDYWNELEIERLKTLKENKLKHDKIYNINPFVVLLEQQDIQAKLEKEKENQKNQNLKVQKPVISLGQNNNHVDSRSTTTKPIRSAFSPKVWENACMFDIPSDIRLDIENSVKELLEWNNEKINESKNIDQEIVNKLIFLGFRESHVLESLNYTSSTFIDSLEWLIFHIPEDDLPPLFSKSNKDSDVIFTISQNLKTELALKRLKNSGFDNDDILKIFKENNENEFETSIKLTQLLSTKPHLEETVEDGQVLWDQEIEALQSTHDIKYNDNEKNVVTIPLNPEGINESKAISVKIFKSSNYPNEIPGIQLILSENYNLANYIKISIIGNLINQLYFGECMIFSIIEWLEINIIKIIQNPGPLMIYDKNEKSNKDVSIETTANKKLRNNKRNIKQDIGFIKSSYINRKQLLQKSIEERRKLPAWNKKDQLIKLINNNQITLITGETGSGKSTQIVQFILDDLNAKGDFSSTILCTQPRRISAIGLASRVSEERNDTIGDEIGYMIRGESKTTSNTRITFLTTGILLRMFQNLSNTDEDSNFFKNLKCLFIDEVHERSVDGDFLLIMLKNLLKKFKNLKIILMSATIKLDKFNKFFNQTLNHEHIEGRTFPIKDIYLDEILDSLNYKMEIGGELIKPRSDSTFFNKGNINYDLIAKLVVYIDKQLQIENNNGSILIFLPGVPEINKAIREISHELSNSWILPLHSSLSSQDQKKVFKSPPSGLRKIVVSTNIAETSITIPDCVVVIDSGRSKSMYFDNQLNSTKLIEEWCSKAEIKQRRGRSGRVTKGICYHLYTTEIENSMLLEPIPEIKRIRLENLYLIVKSMGINNVESFIKSGLDSPDSTSLEIAKQHLINIGALNDESLTNLGKYLSFLPTDTNTGKLLILGCIFGCLDYCSTLAAINSIGNIFQYNLENRDKIKNIMNKYSDNQGDLIAMTNLYYEYCNNKNSNKKFINDNYLSYNALKDIKTTKSQYKQLLLEFGFFKEQNVSGKPNYNLIKAIIAGSFYPNIARVQLPNKKFIKSSQGSLEIDPDAKLIKYWIKNDHKNDESDNNNLPASRVFIHPSSIFFDTSNKNFEIDETTLVDEFGNLDFEKAKSITTNSSNQSNPLKFPFISFRSSHFSSKLYIRDITPLNILSTLLFGGKFDYDLSSSNGIPSKGIILDQWLPIRTWCKNGVLIKQLRKLLDNVIDDKLSQSKQQSLSNSNDDHVIDIIVKILSL
ncbi:ucp12 [Candida pseudojiufengensis]|uniref:ucp12 n=1 Tax=Candida pseudojiufengensis TaxID=497109 RepID=UPI002224F910|nr:ucp12 [Candida pseudojiufengensis]KAI5961590.1 ucp12 [Candida pseudojiufengensis]